MNFKITLNSDDIRTLNHKF